MNAKNWYVYNKTLSSYKCLWRHKKSCQPTGHNSEIPRQHHHTAERERSETVQDLFRKLGSTPLDFQPVGEKPSPPTHDDQNSENETDTEKDDKSSLGSLSDVSPAEDEEDDNMNRKVWRVIVHWGNSNDCSNALDAFKFFKFMMLPSKK